MIRASFLILIALCVRAEDSPLLVVQQLFEAVAHKDAAKAQSLFVPDAMLYSLRADGTAGATPVPKWLERMSASKDQWLETISSPKELEKGQIAHIWAEYTFDLAGKRHHCGVDSVSLLKTAAGWKIVAISDTRTTTRCGE